MFDAATTEFLFVSDLLKATPSEEAGRRFVYVEASNEARDFQGEKVLAKALADSSGYYAKYGNLDIDHYSIIGQRMGLPEPHLFEIGRPAEVQSSGARTFVKGEIYRGDGPLAANANRFWDSLTKIDPPKRWYPSVGGSITARATETDPLTKAETAVICGVRWTNIGFSATPVNPAVPTVSTVPFGILAKCWGATGIDLAKALSATPAGPDVATLTGGAALARQSLDGAPQNYFAFRDRMAGDVRRKRAAPRPEAMIDHAAAHYGLDHAQAAEWTERFMGDLASTRRKRITA